MEWCEEILCRFGFSCLSTAKKHDDDDDGDDGDGDGGGGDDDDISRNLAILSLWPASN